MATQSLDWLNERYVEKILRSADIDESIKVSSIIVKPATAKGDNYTSDMHRVTVDASRVQDGHEIQEKISLIVKVAPQDDLRQELIEASGIFTTELSMMSVILPQMSETLENVSEKGSQNSLCARCLHAHYEKPVHIFIEDLAPRGFRMADRTAGLDLDHCLLAMRNLGRFHAASIALREKEPEALVEYKKGMLHKDQPPSMGEFFNLTAKKFAEVTAKWPELNPRITEKLRKLSEVLYQKGCEAALYKEDDFNVLNHGDYWVNNMLFRYDEQNKPIDHIFVDFQFCHSGSPAIDILYFFGTSPRNDIRLHHRESLLREYYASLTDTMVKMKCKTRVPTFEQLQETLKNRAFCEVLSSLTILPVVVLEKGEEIDLNELLKSDGEYNNPSHNGKTYRNIMNTLLPLYDSMGLLDV